MVDKKINENESNRKDFSKIGESKKEQEFESVYEQADNGRSDEAKIAKNKSNAEIWDE